jgi:argininosuccinate lyase
LKSGKKPGDWTGQQLADFAPEFTASMARLLEPSEGMKTRSAAGGTAPETVAAALGEARERLSAMHSRLK